MPWHHREKPLVSEMRKLRQTNDSLQAQIELRDSRQEGVPYGQEMDMYDWVVDIQRCERLWPLADAPRM